MENVHYGENGGFNRCSSIFASFMSCFEIKLSRSRDVIIRDRMFCSEVVCPAFLPVALSVLLYTQILCR
jgi:hypothetical protein